MEISTPSLQTTGPSAREKKSLKISATRNFESYRAHEFFFSFACLVPFFSFLFIFLQPFHPLLMTLTHVGRAIAREKKSLTPLVAN